MGLHSNTPNSPIAAPPSSLLAETTYLLRHEAASRALHTMVALHTHNPSIYALTAATVVRLLTKRLGAGKAEVEWEEASYSEGDDDGAHRNGDIKPPNSDFAPRGPPKTGKSFKGILPPPLKVRVTKEGTVEGLLNVFAVRDVVPLQGNMKLTRAIGRRQSQTISKRERWLCRTLSIYPRCVSIAR